MNDAPKTLTQLIRERDYLRDRLLSFDMTSHIAYLQWPERDHIEFDVEREKTRIALDEADRAYQEAIRTAARHDP